MPWLSHRGVLVNLRGLYYDAIAIGALFGLAILGGRALIETLGWPRIFVSAGALAMLGWSIRCLIRRRSVPSLPFTPATRPCRDCGAPIFFARTDKRAWLPLDAAPVSPEQLGGSRGYHVYRRGRLVRAYAHVGTRGPDELPAYVPHFATCREHRRKRLGTHAEKRSRADFG